VATLAIAAPSSAYARPIDHRCDTLIIHHKLYQSVMLNPYAGIDESLVAARNDNALIARARGMGCEGI
jgi:hypothetical protein